MNSLIWKQRINICSSKWFRLLTERKLGMLNILVNGVESIFMKSLYSIYWIQLDFIHHLTFNQFDDWNDMID